MVVSSTPGDYSGEILGLCQEMFILVPEDNTFIQVYPTLQVSEDR